MSYHLRFCWLHLGGWVASLFLVGAVRGEEPPARSKYKMPALMMIAWAEWPQDPKQQDVMAKFVRSQGFNCVEVEVDKLELCRKHGLYARLGHGDINVLLRQAAKLKDDKTVFAYFISDRRRSKSFPLFAKIARAYEKVDPNHPTIFINRANWNEYSAFAEQVEPMLLDFYHYHWDGRRHPERRYIYLASFRELGLKHNIPVIRCINPTVPLPQLRQTIYTSLAYGVQGFHFWPPWLFSIQSKDGKPVLDKEGKIIPRTNVPQLTTVAKEIEQLGTVLIGLHSHGVYHTPPVHPEAPGATSIPKTSWVQLEGEHLLMGLFRNGKSGDYILLVNADASRKRTAMLSVTGRVGPLEMFDKTSGKWKPVDSNKDRGRSVTNLELIPGNGELLRVRRTKK